MHRYAIKSRALFASWGLTLIELLIVIFLLALTLTRAVPLTMDWMHGVRLTDTESQLMEAFGMAKAKALRNSNGIMEGNPVAAVCFANKYLKVVVGADNTHPANCASSPIVWSSPVSANITLAGGGDVFSCLCFDSASQLSRVQACATCNGSMDLTVSSGNQHENIQFY
jgi:Tfp pilus assembly protein FimT